MTSQTPEMHAVLERLEKLEKQNRRMKRSLLAAAIVALAAAGTARVVTMRLSGNWQPEVRAERFVLADSGGSVRAELKISAYGPEFTMGMVWPPMHLEPKEAEALKALQRQDHTVGPPATLKLSVFGGVPALVITDDHGKDRASLSLVGLALADHTSKWGAYLTSTGLDISDEDGYGVSVGNTRRAYMRDPQTFEELSSGPSMAEVTVFGKGQKVLWHAP